MKSKFILSVLIIFSFQASYAQGYALLNTLTANDSIAFATLRYGRKDFGFGVVSSKGVMNWQIPVPGYPLGMGKFKNDVVFFYTFEDPNSLTVLKNVHVALIGLSQKKIIEDKVIYTNETRYRIDPVILDDPAGNFTYLLIRTTPLKGGLASRANNAETKLNETTQLSAISLENNLATQSKDIKSIVLESVFASACIGAHNDLYVSSFSKDQLITERFDSDGKLTGKLSTNVSVRTKSQFFPIIKYDSLQGNSVDLALAYSNSHKDDAIRLFRFNFNDQKAYSTGENILDKDYYRQIEKAGGEKSKLSNFKNIDELYPVQIVNSGAC